MAVFTSVITFRTHLLSLLKIKRGIYSGLPEEICKAFKGVTIEQLRQKRDMVLLNNEFVVIKLRLPDKKQHIYTTN